MTRISSCHETTRGRRWLERQGTVYALTKFRVLGLEPIAAFPALVKAAQSLRHDALKAEFTGFGEHNLALGGERFIDQDSADAADEPHQRLAPRLDRTQTQIDAFEPQQVERHKRGLHPAALGHERPEVAPPVGAEYDCFPVDERSAHTEAANRLGDPYESIGEVRTASAPDFRALAQFADKNSETVMLDLVQLARADRLAVDERGFARADEPDRRAPSPAGRGGAP